MREWFDSLEGDTVTVAHGGTMRALMVALGIATPVEASEIPIGQGVVYVFSEGGLQYVKAGIATPSFPGMRGHRTRNLEHSGNVGLARRTIPE